MVDKEFDVGCYRLVVMFALIFIFLFGILYAQQNLDEERICQELLTSPIHSPLLPLTKHRSRDLKYDEDGEFSCELVLQDQYLPVQIRVTIHEGLGWLNIRHVQMGLMKHNTVYRHFATLAKMLPSNFNFNYQAGMWGMEEEVSEPEEVVRFFNNCLYGKASNDSDASNEIKVKILRMHAKALAYVGRLVESLLEFNKYLEIVPIDFGVNFIMKEILQLVDYASINSVEYSKILLNIKKSDRKYQLVSSFATNNYTGFIIPSDTWTPTRFNHVPNSATFQRYFKNREPFIISLNSGKNLDHVLKWNTQKWTNLNYLNNIVGNEKLLVEIKYRNSSNFGYNPTVRKKSMSFKSYIKSLENSTSIYSYYINTQRPYSGEGAYRTPLHLLKNDFSMPSFLNSVEKDMVDVNLWLGQGYHIRYNENGSVSRLHMDATDNVYVLIQGQKKFSIISPTDSLHMKTISPTYQVLSNGHGLQYKVPHNNSHVPSSLQSHHEISDQSNYHFSSINIVDNSSLYRSVTFDLNAGDILFLPTGWFHQVTSYGNTLAINYWFKPPLWEETHRSEIQTLQKIYENKLQAQVHTEL